jgi:outer membrane protein OmpA-like peptidoglycan-associated protein
LGNAGEDAPVLFSWNEINFSSDNYVIVEVATDRTFKNIAATREVKGASSISIPIESGTYRWRAYPASSNSREPLHRMYPSGSLEIIPAAVPVLETPLLSAELFFMNENNVSFSWTQVPSALSYQLEISRNADMRAPIVSRSVNETSVTQSNLDEGSWYWRVSPEYPTKIVGSVPRSVVSAFSLKQGAQPLPVPVAIIPEEAEIVSVETLPEENPIVKSKPILPIIYFISYTADTIEANETVFAHVASVLNENPEYNITVEGHANYTTNPADTAARLHEQTYELKPLSEIRAKAVAENLIQRGIASERIKSLGIGGEKPLAAWDDKSNWQRNRRVEFVLE